MEQFPNKIETSTLRHLSRHMVRQLGMLSHVSGALPLSPVQAHALSELGLKPLSIKQMSVLLNVDKSNASRAISHLVSKDLAQTDVNPRDSRSLVAKLTPKGRKLLTNLERQQNQYFTEILAQLSEAETAQIESCLTKYNHAISTAKLQQGYHIRPLTQHDDPVIAAIIRQVSHEYKLSPDKGFSVADPTLDHLYQIYQAPQSQYWVVEHQGEVLGGSGIAPMPDEGSICELQKMYFLPSLRGKGLAKRLALDCLKFAKQQGFTQCYLETTGCLVEAIKLYEDIGFKHIENHIGNTGHNACEIPMIIEL